MFRASSACDPFESMKTIALYVTDIRRVDRACISEVSQKVQQLHRSLGMDQHGQCPRYLLTNFSTALQAACNKFVYFDALTPPHEAEEREKPDRPPPRDLPTRATTQP